MERSGVKFNHLFIRYFLIMGIISGTFIFFLFYFYGYSKEQGYVQRNYPDISALQNIDRKLLREDPFNALVLPDKTKYILYDPETFSVLTTNMNHEERRYYIDKTNSSGLQNYIRDSLIQINGHDNNYTCLYVRDDGFLILEAHAPYMVSLPIITYKDYPAIPVFILGGVVGVLILIIIFSKLIDRSIRKEIQPVIKTISKIEKRNLDFSLPFSKIYEFNSVLHAMGIMRNSLKNSLNEQWKKEEDQKFQIASLAHDIKTPLTVIKGNTELLLEADNSNMDRIILEDISRNSQKIVKYVEMLLVKEEEIEEVSKGLVSVSELTKNLMEDVHSLLIEKEISIKIIENDMKAIIGDRNALLRALTNILINAIEFTPEKGEVLFLIQEKNPYIEFKVEDQGPGFSDEAIKSGKLKFYTHEKDRNGKHYGIGLYIADQIAKNHNGEVVLENYENGGRVLFRILSEKKK